MHVSEIVKSLSVRSAAMYWNRSPVPASGCVSLYLVITPDLCRRIDIPLNTHFEPTYTNIKGSLGVITSIISNEMQPNWAFVDIIEIPNRYTESLDNELIDIVKHELGKYLNRLLDGV